jgi:hypothetical protein
MIAAFIFYLHIIGGVYAFTKSYCEHKLTDAFMTLAFVAIIFSAGWTIAGFIVRFFFPVGGFARWLDGDTISLIIVTLLEAVLYTAYFRSSRRSAATSA